MRDEGDPWGGGENAGPEKSKSSKKFSDPQFDALFVGIRTAFSGFPEGGGKSSLSKIHLFFLIGAALLLYACTGFYTVNTEEKAVELLFGKYSGIQEPGLRYWFPKPFGQVLKVRVEMVSKEEVGGISFRSNPSSHNDGVMLTGDENIVNINFDVQWKVSDAYNYLFNVRDARPGATVKNAAESAMREIIGKSTLAFAIEGEGRAAIAYETKKLLQNILDRYHMGIEVLSIQLKKVDPPEKVISSFRDVQSARADKERSINEAFAYRNEVLPKAKGEAIRIKLDAEAYKSEVVNRAQGDSSKFQAIYKEYINQPLPVRSRMYIEAMEEVLSNMDKVIVTDDMKGLFSYLPLTNGAIGSSGRSAIMEGKS
ncbi:Modulator of FtsH protease HflK [Anaplasma phagocytophilum]|uniref:FtsH protease activity modulator HflK n=1 Tax=Anaplasma phagocytophilum TaxID=948 RepID=UPI0007DF7F59|nr:FtsH protease activity modulator HflK [Anaplasma phagocytophilum]SCV64030.1 Modulator of FtsH protease HflK [Anaplasma phagocytophilum]SCV64510.1 Modulator of FtsH protease HflK [Anaplasma phagocytophilum]